MNARDRQHRQRPSGTDSAADWYVDADAEPGDRTTGAELAAWLAEDERREAAFERCEASVWLAGRLESDPELAWAFADARAFARGDVAGKPRRVRARGAAWVLAAGFAAAAVVVALRLPVSDDAAPAVAGARPDDTAAVEGPSRSALSRVLVDDAVAAAPAVTLPGEIVVDAGSVAVLPFMNVTRSRADGSVVAHYDAGLATQLHAGIVSALGEIPGVYVINAHAVMPYTRVDLAPSEVAAQLGVRAIVTGSLRSEAGRLDVDIELVDAVDGATLWALDASRPADELDTLRTETVAAVAAALAGAERRRALEPSTE